MECIHALSWVSSRYSSFLPHSKNMSTDLKGFLSKWAHLCVCVMGILVCKLLGDRDQCEGRFMLLALYTVNTCNK